MQKDKTSRLIYSASDLVNFTLCPSVTLYDLQHLETPLEKAKEDPYAQILQEKGIAHETRYLDRLKKPAAQLRIYLPWPVDRSRSSLKKPLPPCLTGRMLSSRHPFS